MGEPRAGGGLGHQGEILRSPLGDDASAVGRLLRRLQSEVQLVFHVHPVNEAREERDEPVVNSIWLSGCGRAQPAEAAASPEIAASLRAPLLAGDWAAWAEAWNALDASVIAALLTRAERGEPIALTLCGERTALRFEGQRRPFAGSDSLGTHMSVRANVGAN